MAGGRERDGLLSLKKGEGALSDHLTTFFLVPLLSLSLSLPARHPLPFICRRRRVVAPVASHVHLHKCEWRMALRWLAGLEAWQISKV